MNSSFSFKHRTNISVSYANSYTENNLCKLSIQLHKAGFVNVKLAYLGCNLNMFDVESISNYETFMNFSFYFKLRINITLSQTNFRP